MTKVSSPTCKCSAEKFLQFFTTMKLYRRKRCTLKFVLGSWTGIGRLPLSSLIVTFILFGISLNSCASAKIELYKVTDLSTVASPTGETATLEVPLVNVTESSIRKFTGTRKSDNLANSKSSNLFSRHVKKFIKKVSKDLLKKGFNELVESFTGISKRSHDSTFALISFVTFATFVVFTLLPLLTLPRRQRLAKQYARKFGVRGKVGPKFIPLQHIHQFHNSKQKSPSTVSYAAVAVPIGAVPPPIPEKSHLNPAQQYDIPPLYNNNNNDNTNYPPNNDVHDDVDDDYSISPLTAISVPLPHQFHKDHQNYIDDEYGGNIADGDGGGTRASGGYASNLSSDVYRSPTSSNTSKTNNGTSDDEYLTKEEIMYLLKTL